MPWLALSSAWGSATYGWSREKTRMRKSECRSQHVHVPCITKPKEQLAGGKRDIRVSPKFTRPPSGSGGDLQRINPSRIAVDHAEDDIVLQLQAIDLVHRSELIITYICNKYCVNYRMRLR